MEGRGVTNYNAEKPSHAFSTATTEFDDALIKRKIVTTEQVMLAKGASSEEAARLVQQKESQATVEGDGKVPFTLQEADDASDDDLFDDQDDEIFAMYRKERLAQFGSGEFPFTRSNAIVEHISREQWTFKVNDASKQKWVLVVLLDPVLGNRRQEILQEVNHLARMYESKLSLVTIEADEAIPGWPSERVPTMFAYRDGLKKQEWIAPQSGRFPAQGQLEELLQQWNILV